MKTVHTILLIGALGAAASFALPAQAQMTSSQNHAAVAATKDAKVDLSEGEVRKVDQENKRITLQHGPVRNLGMPAMTMVFQAADPAMLGMVKVGDHVRFKATSPGGKLTVTEIHPMQ